MGVRQGSLVSWLGRRGFGEPLKKKKLCGVTMRGGGLVGPERKGKGAAPADRLERAEAQATAESFLRDTLHADLSLYDFREEEANLTERPARRDWSFAWERRGFRANDATYRVIVTLAGDNVSGYSEFLKVPDAR